MIDINKLQEITEKLNRSKLLKGVAYDVLNTFIEQQKEQLNLHDVGNHVFCPYCGDKRQLKVETDLNSGRVCKSRLCRGK